GSRGAGLGSTMVSTREDRDALRTAAAAGRHREGQGEVLYSVPRVLFLDDRNIRRTGDSEPGLRARSPGRPRMETAHLQPDELARLFTDDAPSLLHRIAPHLASGCEDCRQQLARLAELQ